MTASRRSFIAGVGGGIFLDIFRQVTNTHQISVEFYFGDEVENAADDWAIERDVSFEKIRTNLINYTTEALSSIDAPNSELLIDVTVHTDSHIDMDSVQEEAGDSIFEKWRNYVDNSETDPSPDADSIILLTTEDHHKDGGRAEIPCQSCSSHDYSTGVVYDFNPYDCMRLYEEENLTAEEDPIPKLDYLSVTTVLHEVGHTIGLEHSDGTVKEDSEFALRATLMLPNLYARYDLSRRENYRLVEYDATIDEINTRSFSFPFPDLL
jgi:hypothetical protein